MGEDARIPKVTPRAQTVSLTTLPLDRTDNYVLSCVDGTSTEEDLAAGLGMPHDRVVDCLEKLAMLGLVTFHAYTRVDHTKKKDSLSRAAAVDPSRAVTPAAPEEQKLSHAQRQHTLKSIRREEDDVVDQQATAREDHVTIAKPSEKRASMVPPATSSDRAASPSAAGNKGSSPPNDDSLSAEEKARIDVFIERCKIDDHYALLGVERGVDKRTVKKAYYALAAMYHPDRHFRSGRSTYRARMEEIFHRLTEAHDTLTDREKRARYDGSELPPDRPSMIANMPSDRPSQAVAPPFSPQAHPPPRTTSARMTSVRPPARSSVLPPPHPSSLGAQANVGAQANAGRAPTDSGRAPNAGPSASSPLPGPPRTPTMPPVSSPNRAGGRPFGFAPNEIPTAVRRVAPPPAARGSVPPPSMDKKAAMDELKRRYNATTSANTGQVDAQIKKYLDLASEALREKDPVSAMNTYRIALTIAPNNQTAKKGLEEAERLADVSLYDSNVKRANDAEKLNDFTNAIKYWTRATRGQPQEVSNFVRGTEAILRGNGDMREAARLAKRAVELRQADVTMRLLLVNVYIAAGMWQSAKTELDRSLEKWPKDDELKAKLKIVKSAL